LRKYFYIRGFHSILFMFLQQLKKPQNARVFLLSQKFIVANHKASNENCKFKIRVTQNNTLKKAGQTTIARILFTRQLFSVQIFELYG
jgi:hypothetical protein